MQAGSLCVSCLCLSAQDKTYIPKTQTKHSSQNLNLSMLSALCSNVRSYQFTQQKTQRSHLSDVLDSLLATHLVDVIGVSNTDHVYLLFHYSWNGGRAEAVCAFENE